MVDRSRLPAIIDDAPFTFPSDAPDREIDYIFAAPALRWRVRAASVIDERVASDHRPVLAVLELRADTGGRAR